MIDIEPLVSGTFTVAPTAVFTAPDEPFKKWALTKINVMNGTGGPLTITVGLNLAGILRLFDTFILAAGHRKVYNYGETDAIYLEANDALVLSDGAGSAVYQIWGGVIG